MRITIQCKGIGLWDFREGSAPPVAGFCRSLRSHAHSLGTTALLPGQHHSMTLNCEILWESKDFLHSVLLSLITGTCKIYIVYIPKIQEYQEQEDNGQGGEQVRATKGAISKF